MNPVSDTRFKGQMNVFISLIIILTINIFVIVKIVDFNIRWYNIRPSFIVINDIIKVISDVLTVIIFDSVVAILLYLITSMVGTELCPLAISSKLLIS